MGTWNIGLWAQQWIPVIASLGVFVVALVAYLSYRQNLDAANRQQWWARAQWAIDSALSDREGIQLMGLRVLTSLKTSGLATPQDAELFDSIAAGIQDDIAHSASVQGIAADGSGPFEVKLRARGVRTIRAGTWSQSKLLEQAEVLLQAHKDSTGSLRQQ